MITKTPNASRDTSRGTRNNLGIALTTTAFAAALLAGCSTPTSTGTGQAASAEMGSASPAASASPSPAPGDIPASPIASPLVQTSATNSAASVQSAFEQVAKAAAPAVVTITTLQRVPTPRSGQAMPFGPFSPFGGLDSGDSGDKGGSNDPLDQLFRQFERRFRQDQGGGSSGGGDISPMPQGLDMPDSSVDLYKVQATRRGRGGGGSTGPLIGAGLGSGFIYQSNGLILTNAHVVQGADRVTVKLADGREFQNARVLGQDARTDLAVVKIPVDNLPTLPLGTSSNVHVGDWSIAVGNPFGLDRTLTVGVISAVNRQVPISDSGPSNYLQTDASINPGNSGGPLLDINGRVVGINDAIYSQTGSSVGIGFAIPIDTARMVADTLATKGHIERAYLGVAIANIDDQAAAFGLPASTKGVLVEDVVPGGPAAKAGLQPGDVITALNGQAVTQSGDFQQRVGSSQIGSTATLTVLRDGKTLTLSAKLTEAKDTGAPSSSSNGAKDESQPTQLGIQLAPLTPDLAARLHLRSGSTEGTVVAGVLPGSPAQVAGIQPGDVIERVGQTPVHAPADVKSAVTSILSHQSSTDPKSVALFVNRHGDRQYVVVGL